MEPLAGKKEERRRARGPIGVEAAAVRAPLLCISSFKMENDLTPQKVCKKYRRLPYKNPRLG
jgi:hypothetical protein